jgi:hypothetical protein
MHVSEADIRAMRRRLMQLGRFTAKSAAQGQEPDGHRDDLMHPDAREDFKIRPISGAWRHLGRRPAYRTAVCNVAYIWRDPAAVDRFGPMPFSFGQRSYELRAAGLMLPNSAPQWASEGYRIWEEADLAAVATGDATALTAWHVVFSIPTTVDERWWDWLVRSFIQRQLVAKGAAVAYAIHALRGADGEWIIHPHAHLVVTGRYYRHWRRTGQRHPAWLSGWRSHGRLERAWQARCGIVKMRGRARSGVHRGELIPWEIA